MERNQHEKDAAAAAAATATATATAAAIDICYLLISCHVRLTPPSSTYHFIHLCRR